MLYREERKIKKEFQLILNPIRDWNSYGWASEGISLVFQLILNPIRDWNSINHPKDIGRTGSN